MNRAHEVGINGSDRSSLAKFGRFVSLNIIHCLIISVSFFTSLSFGPAPFFSNGIVLGVVYVQDKGG